jgi:hypothetical protein
LGPTPDPKADLQHIAARRRFAPVLSLWADMPHDPHAIERWLRDTQTLRNVSRNSGEVPEKW